jgi:hypothetical protein
MESFLQNRTALATASRYTLQPPVEPGFQPFLRPTSSNEEQASAVEGEPASPEQKEPQIELVNREGSVERIVITCTCCQRIELQCEY